MEHPHWVMVAETVLVVLGVIGLHLAQQKPRVMPGERWTPEEEKRLLDLIAARKSQTLISGMLKRSMKLHAKTLRLVGKKTTEG